MHHLLQFIAAIAIGLIFIGDLVLALLSLVKKVIVIFFSSLLSVWQKIKSSFSLATNKLFSTLKRSFRSLHRGYKYLLPLKKKRGRKKKKKTTSLFPLPFGLKLRYFLVGSFFATLFIFLPLLFLLFLQDLPHPKELTSRQIPQTTKIFDRNGALLYEIYAAQNRTLVPLSQIPEYLQEATLAIEDKNFYSHPGFDIQAIVRALKENSTGELVQGGSTITQQLIKSSMLTPDRTVERKVKEIVLAFWAERIYSKEQILEMYFNQIPYGGTAWGVEAASEVYFGKKVTDLTLAESAFLAGITQAPTHYSPYNNTPELWKNRQKEVLGRMVELKYITPLEAEKAKEEDLSFAKPQIAFHAPHFVNYIKDLLVKKYGLAMVEKGGLQVITSLDLSLQEKSEQVVSEEVQKAAYLNLHNGAALITNPQNGDILTMVGSSDFYDPESGNVNVTTSLRQPGSTVKVITYAAALQSGLTPATVLDDSPATFFSAGSEPYKPVNYDGRYRGRVPLRIALANSLNLPAVKVLQQIGTGTMVELGKQMGITNWKNDPSSYGLSTTLGGSEVTMLDMATVNGTLAHEGVKVELNPILKITTAKGDIIEEKKQIEGERVLEEGVAFLISDILADNNARSMAFGSSSPLNIPGHRVSVKTGTSDNKRDNWAIGYTPNYVVTVWVGNNDNTPMSPSLASGISGATPIWNRLMTYLLEGKTEDKLQIPESVVQVPCFGRQEYFLKRNVAGCRFSFTPSRPTFQ